MRDRQMRLEEAPLNIQQKVAEWYAGGYSAAKISECLKQIEYEASPASVVRYIHKKSTQLSSIKYGSEQIQASIAALYIDVVKDFAQISKDLINEFKDIKNGKRVFKSEYERIRAMCDIGQLSQSNVEFANKILSTKVTTSVNESDVLGAIDKLTTESMAETVSLEKPKAMVITAADIDADETLVDDSDADAKEGA